MKDEINGLALGGKFYEAAKGEIASCKGCYFLDEGCDLGVVVCEVFNTGKDNDIIFKYSQSLTDKMNGSYSIPEPKTEEEIEDAIKNECFGCALEDNCAAPCDDMRKLLEKRDKLKKR